MDAVRYMVDDVDAAVRFYVDILGFNLVEQFGPAIGMVERNGATLWLAGPTSSGARPMPDGAKPAPGGWNRIVIEVDDIEARATELRAAGVPFRNELVHGPGGTQVLIEDPSGNPIELFQPQR